MNILITNDDGPNATGLQILLESISKAWPESTPTVITGEQGVTGMSMAFTQGAWEQLLDVPAQKIADNHYTLPFTPADIIYRAFIGRAEFAKYDWDLVLSGVNHGANLGFDIFHSGTVGAAMIAATAFRCNAMAFSQDLPNGTVPIPSIENPDSRELYAVAEKVLPDCLRRHYTNPPGYCLNINFPEKGFKGYQVAQAAHYSYHRTPPTKLVPRASDEKNDISYLLQGFTTVTPIQLRVNPVLRY